MRKACFIWGKKKKQGCITMNWQECKRGAHVVRGPASSITVSIINERARGTLTNGGPSLNQYDGLGREGTIAHWFFPSLTGLGRTRFCALRAATQREPAINKYDRGPPRSRYASVFACYCSSETTSDTPFPCCFVNWSYLLINLQILLRHT